MIQARDVLADRHDQQPAHITIEPIGPTRRRGPLTGDRFMSSLETMTQELAAGPAKGAGFTDRLKASSFNTFEPMRPDAGSGGAYPKQIYVYGYWELGAHEALVVELDLPECRYWNLHLCNHWSESLDYAYHRTSINSRTAQIDGNGQLRVVIAHTDPGEPNWLDTAHHGHGTMVFRFLHCDSAPVPKTHLQDFSS